MNTKISDIYSQLKDSSRYNSPSKECDLVLKGGISSGIVYPLAICKIAQTHKIRRLGGSSAGAIAAIMAAAAEYKRRKGEDSFAGLANLPEQLKKRDDKGRSFMQRLFQPYPKLEYLFEILLALVAFLAQSRDPITGKKRALGEEIKAYLSLGWIIITKGFSSLKVKLFTGLAILAWALYTFGLFRSPVPVTLSLPFGVLVAFLSVLVASIVFTARDFWSLLSKPDHNFGLCPSIRQSKPDVGLTEWMHNSTRTLSGTLDDGDWIPRDLKSIHNRPLVFGDLWKSENEPSSTDSSAILLHTITTCLTLGRPFVIPFETTQFYFVPEELQKVLPSDLVDWMVKASAASIKLQHLDFPRDRLPPSISTPDGKEALALPPSHLLPIVFAARLSLSFPVLLSAIKLWSIRIGTDMSGQSFRTFMPLWFSDGGISSNFPVHLFDAPIPLRPTFAINLCSFVNSQVRHENEEKNVFVFKAQDDFEVHYKTNPVKIVSLGGFLGRIFDTMQNWSDNSVISLDGFRERIVHVQLSGEEGGTNLNMPDVVIDRLALRGYFAAQKLLEQFNWNEHQWLRYTTSMQSLQAWLYRFERGYQMGNFKSQLEGKIQAIPTQSPHVFIRAKRISEVLSAISKNLTTAHIQFARGTLVENIQNPSANIKQFDLKARPRM